MLQPPFLRLTRARPLHLAPAEKEVVINVAYIREYYSFIPNGVDRESAIVPTVIFLAHDSNPIIVEQPSYVITQSIEHWQLLEDSRRSPLTRDPEVG